MKESTFITAAVDGNRELRRIGLSSISDEKMRLDTLAIVYTMRKFNLHTLGEYLDKCKGQVS